MCGRLPISIGLCIYSITMYSIVDWGGGMMMSIIYTSILVLFDN